MVHANWVVGGVTLNHVITAEINPQEGKIVLKCSALNWNIVSPDTDTRDEIAELQALSSQYITNEPLLNGGTKLQIGNGQYLVVTDGTDTYSKCALERIVISENKVADKRIDYDLTIHYELSGAGGGYVYTPNFDTKYTNIEYYCWSDKSSDYPTHFAQGNEIGWMKITETRNIVKVEVYGSACAAFTLYPNWLDVNGEKQYWHYSHDEGDWGSSVNTLPYGWEKLTFNLDTPTTEVILYTPTHLSSDGAHPEEWTGCWLQWIKVTFE